MNPDSIRKTLRAQRAKLNHSQQLQASHSLAEKILQQHAFINAQHIGAYLAHQGEISPEQLLREAQKLKKHTYLPIIKGKQIKFARVTSTTNMRHGKFNIPIPEHEEQDLIEPQELDLIIVPLVAFDPQLNRIGMGGGFYDRSFAFRKHTHSQRPLLIGVAHELQKQTTIHAQSWDIAMDLIITDKFIYE